MEHSATRILLAGEGPWATPFGTYKVINQREKRVYQCLMALYSRSFPNGVAPYTPMSSNG